MSKHEDWRGVLVGVIVYALLLALVGFPYWAVWL